MFSNYDYDIIIIGGGVSGLFLAYKLLNTGLKVIVFESDQKVGGRIESIKKDNFGFEAGAARIHSSHGKVISLIHDLDLRNQMIKLPEQIDLILRGKKMDFNYDTKNVKKSIDILLKESIDFKYLFQEKELQKITFFQYLVLIYDHETAVYIKDAFGYDSEFVDLNADAALHMFEYDLFGDNHYYILQNGLSQIIERMEKTILKSSTILKKNTPIIEINDNFVVTKKKEKFYFNHLICAIPQNALLQFDMFKDLSLVNSVNQNPLLRIYAKYPTKDLWFKNIKRTITDNYIRHIIPIDYDNGLIMICYTDGKQTEYWQSYESLGKEYLIKALHKEIKDLFDIEPPAPEFIESYYWKDGLHTWKVGYDSQKVEKDILKPFDKKEIYICGEAFSSKQGWIEGALDTCYQILNILPPLEFYDKVKYQFMCDGNINTPQPKPIIVPKKTEKSVSEKVKISKKKSKKVQISSNVEDKKEKQTSKKIILEKPEKKVKPENNLLQLEDVLSEDEWIILEVKGKKNVYDISQWIPKHPGGSMILKGVEANKHYENPKLYPESPTELFKGNHVHYEADAWEKYVEKNNDDVKLVGYIQ